MSINPLPTCRHRGEQLLPDRWLCYSDRLVLRTGLVSGETCRSQCPYVDHEGPAVRSRSDPPGVKVDLDLSAISVGLITAPRPLSTLPQTISELRRAGFTQAIHIYAEPAAPVPNDPTLILHRNTERLGIWGNWLAAARRLLASTKTPFILLCEDDVRFSPCAALALQHAIDTLPRRTWGYVSLYTARHNLSRMGSCVGWRELTVGPGTWGSLAWCFTREGLISILNSRIIRSYIDTVGTDSVVSVAAYNLGLKCYFHVPSLGDHTGGDHSTMGHHHGPGEALGIGFSPEYRGYEARSGSQTPGTERIPRLIHQIWIGPLPPPIEWMRTWAEQHPGWEYRLWTDRNIPFPLRNQTLYEAMPELHGKADILRYELLHRYGGVYVDADMRCLQPFRIDDLQHRLFAVYEDEQRQPGLINNCLLGCEPGCPIIEDAITTIGRLTPADVATTPAWISVGPSLLTKCISRSHQGVSIFPSAAFIPVHFRTEKVDRNRLASARAIHYFQSSPASEEFAAFREPLEAVTAVPIGQGELTVVVQTSFVTCHPNTAMLEQSLSSLKLLGCRPHFLFLFDGLRGSAEEEHRYQSYKRQVRDQFPGDYFEAEECVGASGCLRRGLDRVTTPYLLYWEHNWELNRPIDTAGVLRALRDEPGVRSIRLNKRSTLEGPGDLELHQHPPGAVRLVATPGWSSDPHFARTETYRTFIQPRCRDGSSLEGPLLEESLRSYYAHGLAIQHEQWGNCIYGSIGDAAIVSRLDGKK